MFVQKVKAVFSIPDILKQGKAVANPALWKAHQITANMIGAFLGSMLLFVKVFLGWDINVSEEELTTIGSAALVLFGMYNSVITVASSEKVGLPAKQSDSSEDIPGDNNIQK